MLPAAIATICRPLAAELIGDAALRSGMKVPQRLACPGVERDDVAVARRAKDDVARGRKNTGGQGPGKILKSHIVSLAIIAFGTKSLTLA